MTDIFVSYSRRDKNFTQKLVETLKAAKREVWADWESIPASSEWDAEIKEGIQKSDSVLFILSPEWRKSKECRKEMDYAIAMGKRLIPIMYIDATPPAEPPIPPVPAELNKLDYIFMRDSDDFDKGFIRLCSALDTDLDWVKKHTRIQLRAVEWDKKNRDHSFVLRGNDLADGENFLSEAAGKSPEPTKLQGEYIRASRNDATRRSRITLAGVTIALVISILLGLAAWFQRQEAVKQAKISRAGDLAGQAGLLRDTDLALSLLLGVEAYNSQDNYRTRVSLLDNVNVQPKLIRTLVKHSSWVKDVAVSPDGNILATSSCAHYELATTECSEGEFILWDMNGIQPSPRLFHGHSDWIYAVAFDPDPAKEILATAGGDSTIIFWNVERGSQISQLPAVHSSSVLSLAFSPNGKYLVSGDGDGLIILWDLQAQTHKELFTAGGPIKTLAFSPDSQVIAFGDCSNFDNNQVVKCDHPTVNLLSVETGEFIAEPLQGHEDLIETVAFSPGEQLLASGSYDNTVLLWDLEDLEKDQLAGERLSGHLDWVHSIVFINDGLLASGSADGTVALWNTETLENVDVLAGHSDWVTGLAISPDKKILASASDDKTVMLWDIQGYRKPFGEPLAVPNNLPFGIAFDPNSGNLATSIGNPHGGVLFWDRNHRSQILGAIDTRVVAGTLAYSPDGKKLATGGSDGSIIYWNANTFPPTSQGEPLVGHSSSILSLSFSHNGRLLASTSADGVANVWDLNTNPKAILRTFSLLSQYGDPSVLIFSPMDDNLIAYGSDNNLVIYNLSTQEEEIYPGLLDTVSSVAFSPDGTTIAASSYGSIMLWDLSTDRKQGVSLTSQSGNIGEIWKLAFSPDGKTLASRGCGKVDSMANCIEPQIYLWDVESTQLIGAITMGEETPDAMNPFALSFSPDGNYLVSTGCAELSDEGCKEGQIYRWIVAPQLWVENSCQRAGRNLTRAEWEKFGFTETYRKTCAEWPLEPIETATSMP